jgi:mannan endo-1,6-alpha-mannosidase
MHRRISLTTSTEDLVHAHAPQAIFLRNLAYLYLSTKDKTLQSSISTVIEKSAAAALATYNREFNCVGDWTNTSTQTYPAFRSTHLVAAALVAAEVINQGW